MTESTIYAGSVDRGDEFGHDIMSLLYLVLVAHEYSGHHAQDTQALNRAIRTQRNLAKLGQWRMEKGIYR